MTFWEKVFFCNSIPAYCTLWYAKSMNKSFFLFNGGCYSPRHSKGCNFTVCNCFWILYMTLSPFEKKVSHLCSYEQDQSCSEMCIVCDNSRMRWHVQCWNHVKNVKSAADFKSILICISTKSEFNFHSTKVTLWVTRMAEYA